MSWLGCSKRRVSWLGYSRGGGVSWLGCSRGGGGELVVLF